MVSISSLQMFHDSAGVELVGHFSGFPPSVSVVRPDWSFAPEKDIHLGSPTTLPTETDCHEIVFRIEGFPTPRHIYLFLRDADSEQEVWRDNYLLMADGEVKGLDSDPNSLFQCGYIASRPRL